jgi:hypothetical protein
MPNLSSFVMEQQAQTQWCWAAVSVCVFRYFNDNQWPKQCDLVNDVFAPILGGDDCCQNGASGHCNMDWDISEVIVPRGHSDGPTGGPVDFDTLTQQLQNNQAPVVIRLVFGDEVTGHVVAAIGCAVDAGGTQTIKIADPSGATGNYKYLEFANFPDNCYSGSAWADTFFTKAAN